jgi:hypothetical protein
MPEYRLGSTVAACWADTVGIETRAAKTKDKRINFMGVILVHGR